MNKKNIQEERQKQKESGDRKGDDKKGGNKVSPSSKSAAKIIDAPASFCYFRQRDDTYVRDVHAGSKLVDSARFDMSVVGRF